MRTNKVLTFTKILFTLFAIGTIIIIFIAYKEINGKFFNSFLIGYLLLTFLVILYIPIITIINARKYDWAVIRKRLIGFITMFILFGALNYVFDRVFRPSNIYLFREFATAFGLAFGISFFDITVCNKEK